ncbi:hypothetical protein [Arthrobacter humicola]
MNFGTVMRNITLTGGVAPARAYIEELMPDIPSGTIQPGMVFDHIVALDDVAAGYRGPTVQRSKCSSAPNADVHPPTEPHTQRIQRTPNIGEDIAYRKRLRRTVR